MHMETPICLLLKSPIVVAMPFPQWDASRVGILQAKGADFRTLLRLKRHEPPKMVI
jgi:hypothetical protein